MIDLIAYSGLGDHVPSVYSTINEGRYKVTPTRILVKRTDDSSTSSSEDNSSKTSKSKSTKCTGTKQQCELPTTSKHTTGVTVGVAVAVPVAVVLMLLVFIFYIVYKRSKREAQEDNDPDFEGDSEFLPHHNNYEMHNQYSSGDSNQNMREKVDNAFYNGMSMAPPGVSQQQYPQPQGFANGANPFSNRNSSWAADPFQLPETENTESLREFAKQVHNDGLGGYRLASKNGSQVSLQNDQASYMTDNRLSNMRVVTNQSYSNNQYIVPGEARMASVNNSRDTSPLKNNINQQPQNLSYKKLDFSQEVVTFDSDHDDEHDGEDDGFDFESNQNNFNNQPQDLTVETNIPQQDGENQYASSIPLSPEEESIQRMKSIYKVYLDRNETVRDSNIAHHVEGEEVRVEQNNMSQNGVAATLSPQGQYPNIEQPTQSAVIVPQIQVQEDISEPTMDSGNNNIETGRMSHRIASSIYSEAPVQAYHSQLQQQQQYGYNQDPNFAMMQQQQNYGYPQQQSYNNYPPLPNMPSQYMHPQTLEQIGELPMPSKLVYSDSSHSLTSFKQSTKTQQQIQQQQNMMQTARLNGTALNPMDHPEMFYSTDEGFIQQPQMPNNSSMSFVSNNSQMTNVISPHQMRKSIVMTNPATLQSQTTYKPAGSLRNIQPQQQMDPYYQQQQQQMHSRVSGILENTDMIQPPSVGGILPHSGSHEDLRKQLGSSGNYTVQ
ncbi:protein Skg6p [Monosporozyma servazzii]